MPYWYVQVLSAQSSSPLGWFLCKCKATVTGYIGDRDLVSGAGHDLMISHVLVPRMEGVGK